MTSNPDYVLDIKWDERGAKKATDHKSKVEITARIRQGMIDDYLTDHKFVVWIDADIVSYPSNVITQLRRTTRDNISAPFIMIEDDEKRFYDTSGFAYKDEAGNPRRFRNDFPYHPLDFHIGDYAEGYYYYNVESVGCFCIIPSDIYKRGAKHQLPEGRNGEMFTDWYGVCQFGKDLGYQVCAVPSIKVLHANLPKFGEQWH